MHSLAATQREFLRALMSNDAAVFGEAVLAHGLAPAARIDVYRNNVFSNYRGALQAVYPVIERLVGAAFFRHACDRYITEHASVSGDLHDFGAGFDAFLAAYEPAAQLVYLPDVARLEWHYHYIFHAAAHVPLALERLAAIDPQDYPALTFTLHPATALLRSAFPLLRIWQVNQPDYTGDDSVDLGEGGDALLIAREDFAVTITRLPAAEYELLAALRRGAALAEAVEVALAVDAAFDLQSALVKHVGAATIVNFSLGAE